MAKKIAKVSEIEEGKGKVIHLNSEDEIALFKLQGKIYAIKNQCPHMGGPLGEGEVEGTTVTCPWHGWQFNCTSGECLNMPGIDVDTVRIIIEGDEILLEE